MTKPRKKGKPAAEPLVGIRTVLRPVTADDLPVLRAWDDDPAIIELMGRRYADQSVEDWFGAVSAGQNCRAWVIESHDTRVVGELELAHLNWRTGSAELRVCIGEKDCWNQGFGTDAIGSALHFAFERYELRAVYLRVFMSNTRAVRVYERLGFRKEAILEPSVRRNDPAPVLLMSLTRERWARLSKSA